ncbi:MAG: ATP-binding cassette domain-containing protein [bacterium]
MPPLISLRGARLAFGGPVLFEDIDLHVERGDRIALVGRNGSGKSTLLRVIAGQLPLDAGERVVPPHARIVYLPQEPDLGAWPTVRDAVLHALPQELAHEPWRVDAALADVDLPGDRAVGTLSGGELRRAALARMWVTDPDIILLDEPTNHLDLPTIEWLEGALATHRAGLVIVSHDRAFLTRLTRTTLWLERGVLHRTERGFADFEAWSTQLLEEEAAARHKLDRLIAEETRWSREGISARRTRNQGRLRRLHALRAERAAHRKRAGAARLIADAGEVSGKIVIEAKGITKSFGDRPIIQRLDTTILRGDRVAIIGPNGSGKTTLLKLLMGQLPPDQGTIRQGTQLTPVYLDQHRATLDPEATLQDILCIPGTDRVMVHGQTRHVAGYLKDFLFEGRDARRPVSALSGGERARLLLARDLREPGNLLVLDEPTNDLDLETLDLLQEVLGDYEGTLLLVSHDRDFIDRLATSTIAYEGNGRWTEYAGGYTDYLTQRPAPVASIPSTKAAPAATKPKRAKTKLSYKEQREHESLPDRITALEAEITTLEATLADPTLYRRDHAAFKTTTARLEAARAEHTAAEDRWLELEMLREELEG